MYEVGGKFFNLWLETAAYILEPLKSLFKEKITAKKEFISKLYFKISRIH
jgi:hypothetical protein